MSLWLGTLSASGISIPAIGESAYGGYMAGIIDTTRSGSIDPDDSYQTGARYLLIVSPRSLQANKQWHGGSDTIGPKTRWNGLGVTEALASTFSTHAVGYCHGLSYPSDGGSRWYLPAIDEMELLYRNLKPTTNGNSTAFSSSNVWPWPTGVAGTGENLSSDPTGSTYPSSSNPGQTSLSIFQDPSGSQRIYFTDPSISGQFWTATSPGNNPAAWVLLTANGSAFTNNGSGTRGVRPVRRILI